MRGAGFNMCHIKVVLQYFIYKDKDQKFVLSWQLGYTINGAIEKFVKPKS
jgi:hypothetical protein